MKKQEIALAKIYKVLTVHGIPEKEIDDYTSEIAYDIDSEPEIIISDTDDEVFETYKEWKELQ